MPVRRSAFRRYRRARRATHRHTAIVDGRRIRSRTNAPDAPDAPDSPDSPDGGRTGPVVVLIPGLGLSGRYLLPLAAELARRREVWVPDPPGFGASDDPPDGAVLDIGGLADALAAWMGAIGLERAAVGGNSMGCQVAVELAVRHPDRVSHLVLEAPTIDAQARTLPPQLWRIARDALREPVSLGPLQVGDWSRAGPRRLARTTRHMLGHAIEERLRAVRAPTLVVCGGRDPIVPARWAEEVAAAAEDSRLHVEPRATHAMPFRDPEVLAAVIDGFLDGREVGVVPRRADDAARAAPAAGSAPSARGAG